MSAQAAGPADAPAWQEKLTLGPGDTISISTFGRADSLRSDIPVGPDGKISYLEAHDITVAGLTIDELRGVLEAELGKYYRNVRTIVTPGILGSKRYFMLGKVVDKGVFTLDRPLTILEAVARSRGLETGLFQQNTVELADLPRAFLSRRGKRMPVDFERLFQRGDLSQNIALEPDDYLYFPSANVNEVYVLGAVKSPGIQGFTPNASVIGMVTVRGGFTEKAYLDKVLVVRGSLTHPETFVVDARKILSGKSRNFALQPKDIVFVAEKPWARAEELLDVALRTFMQAAAAGWASENVGSLITAPIIPTIQ
jgi:protein involved in polysaccharide export with SLBB domain